MHYLPGLVEIQEYFLQISHDGLNSVWPSSPCLVRPDKQIYIMQTPCIHPCLSLGGSLPGNHERHTLLPVEKKLIINTNLDNCNTSMEQLIYNQVFNLL